MEQALHHLDVVIDALEQHGLAPERDAGVRELLARAPAVGRQLDRVREMHAQEQRVVAPEDGEQSIRDALRHHRGHLRPDAQDLDVLDRAQLAEQPIDFVVRERERVAAGDQDVAHLGVLANVLDAAGPPELARAAGRRGADHARPRAVATIGRAQVRREEQDAVRVPVHEAGHRAVVVLSERVVVLAHALRPFARAGDDAPADRIVRRRRIEEAEIVRRHRQRQRARTALERGALVIRELDEALELLERVDAVAHLPMPVVPVGLLGLGEEPLAELHLRFRWQ